MEPQIGRLTAPALAVAAAIVVGSGCGAPSGIALAPRWSETAAVVSPNVFGHNTVWSQGGLGLWDDNARQLRADVVGKVSALHPGVLRFPGGTRAMRYHFDQAIGAARAPECDSFKGTLDATGYGPEEFLALATQLGSAVTWVAPWVDGSPQETAAAAAFLVGDAASTVTLGRDGNGKDWGDAGSWARRRAQSAPYASVRWLEVGNEPYLGLATGPATSCGRASPFVQDERWAGGLRIPTTAADYAAQLVATASLVRAVAPSLRIGAPATSQYDGSSDAMTAVGDVDVRAGGDPWNARLVADAGGAFDFWILHPYDFSVDDEARMHLAERLRKTVRDLKRAAPDKPVAVTEFGFLFGGGTLLNALVTADMTRVAIEEQLLLDVRHILIEEDPRGPFADSAAIGPGDAEKPGYYAAQLLAAQLLDTAVPLAGVRDGALVPDGTLVALATRDAATRRLAVVVIDRRLDDGAARQVRLTLPPGAWSAHATTLGGDTLAATTVRLADADLGSASGSLRLTVPAHALVLLSASAR